MGKYVFFTIHIYGIISPTRPVPGTSHPDLLPDRGELGQDEPGHPLPVHLPWERSRRDDLRATAGR